MTTAIESGGVAETGSRVRPRLAMGHSTLAARDLDALQNFYCDVLGFDVTNRGPIPDGLELAFLSQDPSAHHQIAMVSGVSTPPSDFVMVDHLAFRAGLGFPPCRPRPRWK